MLVVTYAVLLLGYIYSLWAGTKKVRRQVDSAKQDCVKQIGCSSSKTGPSLSLDRGDLAFLDGERKLTVLERERLFTEQLAAPACQAPERRRASSAAMRSRSSTVAITLAAT